LEGFFVIRLLKKPECVNVLLIIIKCKRGEENVMRYRVTIEIAEVNEVVP
jgi:hypothetical protein